MTSIATSILALGLVALLGLVAFEVRRKNMHIWLGSYLRQRRPTSNGGPIHVMFMFVDHYEPKWRNPSYETEVARVKAWSDRYPALAARHRDADGVHPQHTFFYPEEEYRPEHLSAVEKMCSDGFGEIEVHLHHDHDTEAGLREKIERFVKILSERHGALSLDPVTKRLAFGFIHGNWALDNSRSDGRWCGVNNELKVLADLGCYADFTLPSAPSDTQTAKINSIYYAVDDPRCAKSHDDGVDATVGRVPKADLLVVQGPLALNWKRRKWGFLPRLENADIRLSSQPTEDRVDLWVRQHIHVKGRPDWVFVKVHTHGTQEPDMETLLGAPMDRMFSHLESAYNDGTQYQLHYVTSREAYNIIKAAESGKTGNPNAYRDFYLPRPRASRRVAATHPVHADCLAATA
jgi:hypothetical protein